MRAGAGHARGERATGGARRGRALGLACLGLAVAAGLLWGASAAVWYRAAPPGRSPVATDGAAALPALTGVALLALAGIAGVVATAGLFRRALACLLGLAGVAVAWFAAAGLFSPPAAPAGADDALRQSVTAAPLLAVAGGLALLVVGVFVLLREPRLARLGARYAAAGARPTITDPDRAAWVALDEGRDPTAEPDDPGDGRRDGAV
ncbi:MAG TPA: Trp biosynthesis-associated membrane protein [Pseudonocardia sp.]